VINTRRKWNGNYRRISDLYKYSLAGICGAYKEITNRLKNYFDASVEAFISSFLFRDDPLISVG
jgi:hypothetical protein